MTCAPRCSRTCTPTARCASTTSPRRSARRPRTSRPRSTGSCARATSSARATASSPTPPPIRRPASTWRTSAATPSPSRSTTTSSPSFPAFVERAQAHVEREAAAHADDMWWVLEPVLLVDDGAGGIRAEPVPDRGLEAIRPPGAVALHVDLALGGGAVPAIVLAARGKLADATLYAVVERTDAGLPRLGPWQPAPELAAEVAKALRVPRP